MNKVLLSCLLVLGLCLGSISAQTIDTNMEMQERARAIKEKSQAMTTEMPEHIRKSAEAAFDTIFNGKVSEQVEAYKNSMTFDPETGIVKFDSKAASNIKSNLNDDINMAKNGIFKSDERIYIFISSSIPKEILNNYKNYIQAKKIGDTVSFVIRGCLPQGGGFNGCKDFKPTIEFARSMIISDDNKTSVSGLLIDPVLFNTYGVTNVPQVVYAKNVNRRVDLGSEGDFSRLESTPQWWKSVGDWSMDYHLRELYDLSKEDKLKQLYDNFDK